jgi:hypothetical protein
MSPNINQEEIKKIILAELPKMLKRDPSFRDLILRMTRDVYADKKHTEGRIERILDELKRDREEQFAKWQEQSAQWQEQAGRWEAQDKKWVSQDKKWEEQARRWVSQDKKWEEQDKKWWENQRQIEAILQSIKALNRRFDGTLGALGARWGLSTEESFRNALRGILEESFGVKVERYLGFDADGFVMGRPDQVELDVIIHDGHLILCEIKSSMSRFDVLGFWRKVQFYQDKNQRQATRVIIISPMVDPGAMEAAKGLGIEVYSFAEDLPLGGE